MGCGMPDNLVSPCCWLGPHSELQELFMSKLTAKLHPIPEKSSGMLALLPVELLALRMELVIFVEATTVVKIFQTTMH